MLAYEGWADYSFFFNILFSLYMSGERRVVLAYEGCADYSFSYLLSFCFFYISGERQVVLAYEGWADFLIAFFRYRARGGWCWPTRGGLIILSGGHCFALV